MKRKWREKALVSSMCEMQVLPSYRKKQKSTNSLSSWRKGPGNALQRILLSRSQLGNYPQNCRQYCWTTDKTLVLRHCVMCPQSYKPHFGSLQILEINDITCSHRKENICY